ncbi:MAG: ferredoxin--NADP reductase [Roseovarius sp.]|nr:ferredoxin--NADP reductase [Roseovarius sp.]
MFDTHSKPAKQAESAAGERVTSVTHWTDRLFSFRIERPRSFRFRSGEFVMIGLQGDNGKPLLRAYSVASPSWDEELEFYSIKVPDGPLTSRLQLIEPGDRVILRPKPTGTLVLDALLPGKRLYMFATGTGIAPFASLIRDPETYAKFDDVILTHTCRTAAELAYGEALVEGLRDDPLIGEEASAKLTHYTTVTQEDHPRRGRITERLGSGALFSDLGIAPMDPATDRAMICGSMGLNADLKNQLNALGLTEGANSRPAEYVLEKAFVG